MGFSLGKMFSGAMSGAGLGAAFGPIGAIAGAVGGGILGGTQEDEATSAIKQQYKYTSRLQEQNQDWQEYMSNTSHQREVKDLEAAGLNPILSAGGNGASTGTPGGGTVGMPDKVAEKTAKMQNAIAAAQTLISAKSLENETANSAVQRAKGEADIINETNKANAEVIKAMTEAGLTQKQIDYYMKHGVFPGATVTKSRQGSVGFGLASGGYTETTPIGLEEPENKPTTAKKQKENEDEPWYTTKGTNKRAKNWIKNNIYNWDY